MAILVLPASRAIPSRLKAQPLSFLVAMRYTTWFKCVRLFVAFIFVVDTRIIYQVGRLRFPNSDVFVDTN